MLKTIWFMWKEGEERTYARTTPPPKEWVDNQVRDGWHLVSFEIRLPTHEQLSLGTVGLEKAPQVAYHINMSAELDGDSEKITAAVKKVLVGVDKAIGADETAVVEARVHDVRVASVVPLPPVLAGTMCRSPYKNPCTECEYGRRCSFARVRDPEFDSHVAPEVPGAGLPRVTYDEDDT